MLIRTNWPRRALSSLVFACLLLVPAASTYAQFKKITTLAGNGTTGVAQPKGSALSMPLSNPFGVQPEADGGMVIASYDQHVIYRLDPTYSRLELVVGTGSEGFTGMDGDRASTISMNQPHEVQVDSLGNIYVADTSNHRVGMVDASTFRWKNVAGTGEPGFSGDGGSAAGAKMNQAYSIALDDKTLFIADLGNHRIRQVDLQSGIISTICGTGRKEMPLDGGIALDQSLAGPRSLAVDRENLWIVLREGNSVWRISRDEGHIHHVAGTGEKGASGDGQDAKRAKLNGPKGIAVDPGRAIYIADTENHAIRKVDLLSGRISTVVGVLGKAGFNGDGDEVERRLLSRPHGVCYLSNGSLLVGDSENHRLRILVE